MDDARKSLAPTTLPRRPKARLIRSGSFQIFKQYVCSRSCHVLPYLLQSILLSRTSINQAASRFARQCKASLLSIAVYLVLVVLLMQLCLCLASLSVFGALSHPGLVFLLSTMGGVGGVAIITIRHDKNKTKKSSRTSRCPTKTPVKILRVHVPFTLAKFKLN